MAFQLQGRSLGTHHAGCGESSRELLHLPESPALLLFQQSPGLGTGSQRWVCTWNAILESSAQLPSLGWRGATSQPPSCQCPQTAWELDVSKRSASPSSPA